MLVRIAVALAAVAAVSVPALAEPLNAEAARHFVAGKLFSFTCFEGTTGTGRIFNDGSVAGVVRMQGSGNTRFMLPEMTDRMGALAALSLHNTPARADALADFYRRFAGDPNVVDKWFALQAGLREPALQAGKLRLVDATPHVAEPNRPRGD